MPLPLACRVSAEKSADIFMGVPLYVICCFLLLDFNIFSLSLICQFDYCVSQHVPPWVYPALHSLCFLDLGDCFLSHVREIFSYFLFKYFLRFFLSLFSFWGPYNANVVTFFFFKRIFIYLFFKFLFIYLFIYGCFGFSLPRTGFL